MARTPNGVVALGSRSGDSRPSVPVAARPARPKRNRMSGTRLFSHRSNRSALAVLLALTVLAALPVPANAVLSGTENGRIVMSSGRGGGDPLARLYLLPVPSNSVGGGTIG